MRLATRSGTVFLLGALLGCASPEPQPAPGPGEAPFPTGKGYTLYVLASDGRVAAQIRVPDQIADPEEPRPFMRSVSEAFCAPILDESQPEPEERLLNYCRRTASPEAGRRVTMTHSWSQPVPPTDRCFIHCVCEGRADGAESGPCTDRLNCRLRCPTD